MKRILLALSLAFIFTTTPAQNVITMNELLYGLTQFRNGNQSALQNTFNKYGYKTYQAGYNNFAFYKNIYIDNYGNFRPLPEGVSSLITIDFNSLEAILRVYNQNAKNKIENELYNTFIEQPSNREADYANSKYPGFIVTTTIYDEKIFKIRYAMEYYNMIINTQYN